MSNYDKSEAAPVAMSHEDRIDALEHRLHRLEGAHIKLEQYVFAIAHKVGGMDAPEEL